MAAEQMFSDTFLDRLDVWLTVYCAPLNKHEDFLLGLLTIIDEEIQEAVRNERKRLLQGIQFPRFQ